MGKPSMVGGASRLMYVGLDMHKLMYRVPSWPVGGGVVKRAKFRDDHVGLDGLMEGLPEAQVPWRRATAAAPLRGPGGVWAPREANPPANPLKHLLQRQDNITSERR